eukprot:Pgem_evm1s19609
MFSTTITTSILSTFLLTSSTLALPHMEVYTNWLTDWNRGFLTGTIQLDFPHDPYQTMPFSLTARKQTNYGITDLKMGEVTGWSTNNNHGAHYDVHVKTFDWPKHYDII